MMKLKRKRMRMTQMRVSMFPKLLFKTLRRKMNLVEIVETVSYMSRTRMKKTVRISQNLPNQTKPPCLVILIAMNPETNLLEFKQESENQSM